MLVKSKLCWEKSNFSNISVDKKTAQVGGLLFERGD